MYRKLLLCIALACTAAGNAQLIVSNTQTPAQLLQNSFLGATVTASNIRFNGSTANANAIRDQAAAFSTNFNPTDLGLTSGMILCTGKATVALGPNNNDDATVSTSVPVQGDPDLALVSGSNTIRNIAVLEFDFVANGNTVAFQYIFASEEYPEFVNSLFNDVFGIFVSGPGITGPYSGNAKNIALVPGNIPVSINNINNGLNNGGPCENCSYYVNNGTGSTPATNTGTQFDGFTTVLTASSDVIVGETYHVKIALANVSDNAFESAVFLKAGSFSTPLKNADFVKGDFQLYPNPAQADFEIRLDNDQIASVKLHAITGETVKQLQGSCAQLKVDVSDLAKGFYMVEIETENHFRLTKKLIVE